MNEAVAAAQALARDDDVWLPDQFTNPANPEAHRRTTGPELWEALDGKHRLPRRRRRHRRHDHRRRRVPEGAQPGPEGDRASSRPPRRCSPAGGPGRTRSRASARASSRRCSTATCSTRSSPSTTRTRSRPRGSPPAARACWPASPAAPRCARRSRSPSGPRPRASGSRSCCRTPASATSRRRSSRPSPTRRRSGMSLREVEGPAGAPWERPLHGTLDRLVVESDALAGNPLGDPARRPLYVYRPPGVELDHPRPLPSVYVIQGYTGQLDMWFTRNAVRADDDRAPRRAVRRRRLPGRDRRVRRRLDELRRLAVPQLDRAPAATWTTCATRSSPFVDERYPTLAEPRPPRADRQVVRRLRRDGRADAAPGRLRRARLARRRRAVRGLLPAGVPEARAHAARRLRGLVDVLLRAELQAIDRLDMDRVRERSRCTATRPPTRPTRAARARRCCRSTSRPGRLSTTCGRSGWRRTRCGWRRATPTRCARCAASTSTPASATSTTSTSARRRSPPSSTSSASSTRSSSSTASTAGSPTATRARSASSCCALTVTARTLDITDLTCPMTWVRTKLELERMAPGEELGGGRAPARRWRTCRARPPRPGTTSASRARRVRIVRR